MQPNRQLSTRDKRVQTHVNFQYPDEGASETEEELAARQARNLAEWKQARSAAERVGNTNGVKMLDDERMRGMGTDFPHDDNYAGAKPLALEDDLGFVADDLGFTPEPASQATVRKAEPKIPLQEQSADERAYYAALQAWLQTDAGRPYRFYPYNDPIKQRAAFTKATGRKDPATDAQREVAKVEHAANTGEVVYEDSTAYNLGKPLAGMTGFAVGGPAGATAAEMAVRYGTLSANLDRAVKAGAIDEDRAAEILAKEMVTGTGVDAAWNFGVPAAGLIVKKLPGAAWVGDKLKAQLEKLIGRALPAGGAAPTLRDVKVEARAGLTDAPARQQAVRELSERSGADFIPSPGQVTGNPGYVESVVNRTFTGPFIEQEKAFQAAAEGMRRDAMYPDVQPGAKALGERITAVAEDYVKKVKARLRPTFEEADNLGVNIKMKGVYETAKKALAEDAAVAGGKLSPAERAHLEKIVANIKASAQSSAGHMHMGPEATLDFISTQKEKLRTLNADGKPSTAFEGIVGKLTKEADKAYAEGARYAQRGDIVEKLERARKDYRVMMETVYDDAVKQALKKNPEDVGRLFWQSGNVSEIEQLHRLLKESTAEGSVSKLVADKTKADVTRGFLQEAVPNIETAAKWSKMLAEDPKRARTWAALTAGPTGAELRKTMEVLEHAAQMATSRDTAAFKKSMLNIPIGRAAQGGLGISLVTGAVHAPLMVAGLGIASTMNMMATAAVRGDKGTLNLITKVLRLRDASTGGSVQALRAAAEQLNAKAKEYGVEVFAPQEETE